jgi:hypothetical protein
MIRTVAPFKRFHYEWLTSRVAAADVGLGVELSGEVLAQLEAQNSWTGAIDGVPIVCAGTMLQWPGRHAAWAYLGDDTAPHMLWITKETLARLDAVKGRIEATVRCDFSAGHRWAKMLGFKVETPLMERFGPGGEDHTGYVRFN